MRVLITPSQSQNTSSLSNYTAPSHSTTSTTTVSPSIQTQNMRALPLPPPRLSINTIDRIVTDENNRGPELNTPSPSPSNQQTSPDLYNPSLSSSFSNASDPYTTHTPLETHPKHPCLPSSFSNASGSPTIYTPPYQPEESYSEDDHRSFHPCGYETSGPMRFRPGAIIRWPGFPNQPESPYQHSVSTYPADCNTTLGYNPPTQAPITRRRGRGTFKYYTGSINGFENDEHPAKLLTDSMNHCDGGPGRIAGKVFDGNTWMDIELMEQEYWKMQRELRLGRKRVVV